MERCPTLLIIKKMKIQSTRYHHTLARMAMITKTLPFVTSCINLQDIMLHEISKTQEDKNCMASLICGT